MAIDDRTRIAYAQVLRDETSETTAAFLRRALVWYRTLGLRVRRILTDNGSGYVGRRFAHELELEVLRCRSLRFKHAVHGVLLPRRERADPLDDLFVGCHTLSAHHELRPLSSTSPMALQAATS